MSYTDAGLANQCRQYACRHTVLHYTCTSTCIPGIHVYVHVVCSMVDMLHVVRAGLAMVIFTCSIEYRVESESSASCIFSGKVRLGESKELACAQTCDQKPLCFSGHSLGSVVSVVADGGARGETTMHYAGAVV